MGSRPTAGLGCSAVCCVPLARRQFTLTAEKVRIGDALQALREQGITVSYDEAAFQRAGVDFEKRVDLKLNKASAGLFLTLLCEPLGVEYAIEGTTVTLTLKK